jgi:subtilisin family serine protease
MQHKRLWSALLILVLLLAVAGPAFAQDGRPLPPVQSVDSELAIAGRYIVVFKAGADVAAVDAAIVEAEAAAAAATVESTDASVGGRFGVAVHYRYADALLGFAASMPASSLEALQKNPNVDYIEADQIVTIDATQTGATWGLDRIDQTALPLNGTYIYNNTGANVRAYIIDTGILTSHNEFGGRAVSGYDFVDNDPNAIDCNGHGTHVAGTVGGTTYGVAKSVSLVAVRVLDCGGSGTTSGVIAGVDWVTTNAQKPAVANMSLGGGISSALDTAVTNAINSGVTFAVAAGNSNRDACKFSPARVPAAITVGATTNTDARASYSNYGSCLDLFAPGSSITSAWYTSNTATNTISGTSMATPHVAGVAALYLQGNSGASTTQVRDALVNGATPNVVINAGRNSPNRLLFTAY